MRKYKLNENFFEKIDSEEKAYFLGLLYADGYINEKLNFVELTLHQRDSEILNILVNFLYPEGRPLKIINEKYLRLIINSKKIVNDLKKYGCFQKKTFKLKFPTIIENHLFRHFIRGYFDGDGSVYENNGTLNISIVGTVDFLNETKKILINNCNVNETKFDIRHPERNNNICALRYGGNIIINRIYHYLYDNSTIYLKRKYNKFLVILKNKDYFCDNNKIRILTKHIVEYCGNTYNYSELSRFLGLKFNLNSKTIRRKLHDGWNVEEIISTPLNKRRESKLKKIIRIDLNGNEIEYKSINIAAKENNCHISSIYQAIIKNKKLHKYYWKYEQ